MQCIKSSVLRSTVWDLESKKASALFAAIRARKVIIARVAGTLSV
jgi:hypothetical protein